MNVGVKGERDSRMNGDSAERRALVSGLTFATIVAIVVALVSCPMGALAVEYDESIDITIAYDSDPPEKTYGPYTWDEGQVVTIKLTVSSGFGQNFYVLTHDNWVLYEQGATVGTIEELSKADAMAIDVSWTVEATDDYYLIIQNVQGPSMFSDATIHGTLTAEYPAETNWILIGGIIAVIVVVVIVVVFFLVMKKPKGAGQQATVPPPMYGPQPMPPPPQGAYAQAPPPQAPPPQQTYYQPPAQVQSQPAPPPPQNMPRMCRTCGRTVTDGAMRFCPNCGANLG
jgi:hypothetical protein